MKQAEISPFLVSASSRLMLLLIAYEDANRYGLSAKGQVTATYTKRLCSCSTWPHEGWVRVTHINCFLVSMKAKIVVTLLLPAYLDLVCRMYLECQHQSIEKTKRHVFQANETSIIRTRCYGSSSSRCMLMRGWCLLIDFSHFFDSLQRGRCICWCSRVKSMAPSSVARKTLPATIPSSNLFIGRFRGHGVFRVGMMFYAHN